MTEATPTTEQLLILRDAFGKAAFAELTRKGAKSPLAGHCGIVALVVQGMFGGDILEGSYRNCRHFWNRLPDGQELDFTSCQFGGDGIHRVAKKPGRVALVLPGEFTDPRAILFASRAMVILGRKSTPISLPELTTGKAVVS